ncbi:guided entry of tail-anchored proteins factor 1-like [Watersipora subatra]|uniref:guided entry of tail-anchored proteins factor 1-like n=1 Tax=Watersipora subatra TaxID=2589382 RepID=UPI00355B3272
MWTWLLILCLTLPLCARFLPSICVHLWMHLKGRAREAEDLMNEIKDLKDQQAEISMVDEFAKHAKLNRKINSKTAALKTIQQTQIWIRWKAYYYAKIGLYVISAVVLLVYRKEPVLFFDISTYLDNSIVYIVGYILSFPIGMPGAVGMPVALFVCNRVVNQLLNFVTSDKSKQALLHEPVE